MDSGFISLHRKMRKAVWYGKPEYVAAWVHMLFKANYKDTEVMHGNQVIKLKRGQFISGRKALSSEIGVSEQRLRSILKSFKTNQQINQQSFSKYSVFTVVNYDDYQLNNQQENQQITSKQPTNNQQATTENKVNKVNKDNKRGADSSESPAPASKSKTLKNYLYECEKNNVDAIPTDSIVFTNADKLNLPHGYVLIAWEHFKNHWLENKSNARKTNWVSTFNNCLKDSGYSAYQRNQNGEWYLTTKGKNTKILNGIAA